MKAEHRHELKTNELAKWMADFPNWFKQNSKTIIYLTVLAIVVIGVGVFKWYGKNVEAADKRIKFTRTVSSLANIKSNVAMSQGSDSSPILIQPGEDVLAMAQNADSDTIAALAYIKHAEILRAELHFRYGVSDPATFNAQIERAKASYLNALEKANGDPSLTSLAQFGLGLCAEDLKDFAEAKKIYSELASNMDLEGTIAVEQAKLRLLIMDDYKEAIAFRPAPVEETEDIFQPEIELMPGDVDAAADNNLVVE